MNHRITIAALAGLALGLVTRHFMNEPAITEQPAANLSRRTATPSVPETLVAHSFGNLSMDEILALPKGSARTAEFTLWALEASSEQIALYWDETLKEGTREMWILDHILTCWVRRFPDEAFSRLQGTPEEYRYWWALGKLDPDTALARVDQDNSNNLAKVLRGIGSEDPDLALRLLKDLKNVNSKDVLQGLLDGLIKEDPERAMTLIANHQLHDWRHLNSWIEQDPKRAFSWFLENRQLIQEYSSYAYAGVIPQLMAKDAEWTSSMIASLPSGPLKTDLHSARAKFIAKSNPEEALKLADQESGITRARMISEIMGMVAKSDPAKALEIFRENCEPLRHVNLQQVDLPQQSSSIFVSGSNAILNREIPPALIEHDPESVMEIAADIPGDHGNTLRHAFHTWSQLAPADALNWLENHPNESGRDTMIQTFVGNLHYHKPHSYEQVLRISASLQNNQEKLTQKIISQWHHDAPVRAREFFKAGGGTPEQQEIARQISESK